jgi:hypothetical protein
MPLSMTWRIDDSIFKRVDPVLIAALLLALVFSLHGIKWGRVEDWNRDQMAMRELRGLLPLSYEKPPLHTYLNHILILGPIDRVENLWNSLRGKSHNFNEARLVASRLLVLMLFCGTICVAYVISRGCFGKSPARIITLAFASSAGFVEYNHFLSCDSPLLFFLLLTLLFALRIPSGKISAYMLAGFSAGLCTATKYNGLVVGVTLIAAHIWSNKERPFSKLVFDRRLLAGLVMMPIGFVMGDPGALLDFRKFVADFTYNSKVTPYYDGTMKGHGYVDFLSKVPEIVGLPGAIVLGVGVIFSLVVVLRRFDWRSRSVFCFTLAATVFTLYYLLIGSFPRLETRFVLPAVPFLLLMAGPFLQAIVTPRKWTYSILIAILLYNCACGWLVGRRFNQDPRLKAQVWIEHAARPGLVLESSAECPRWAKLPDVKVIEVLAATERPPIKNENFLIDWRMPYAYGRLQLFRKTFPNDSWIQKHVAQYEIEADEKLFTRDELLKRDPDFVIAYSSDYQVPSVAIKNYYMKLLAGDFPYDIVFDGHTRKSPRWTYPRKIDFLEGRITILKRRSGA